MKRLNLLLLALGLAAICGCQLPVTEAGYKPVEGKIMTRWAADVSPDNVHKEYPRPQMVRRDWLNLNGLWDYAIRPKDDKQPAEWDGKILVPFAIESALSGVGKTVGPDKRLWYKRTFKIPSKWKKQDVLLNFGAVDWDAAVIVNGKTVGSHKGGYDPFTINISDALKDSGTQEIVLSVWDPTNAHTQPRGKQVAKPRGIWYTSVTGIWQTVWLEPVQEAYIRRLKITPDIDNKKVVVSVETENGRGLDIKLTASGENYHYSRIDAAKSETHEMTIAVPSPELWTPDSPVLYDLKAEILSPSKKVLDSVKAYFGMRKILLGKDDQGVNRLFLNNEPLFQYGPLDQGWWPDGLYTPASDEALKYDVEVLKKLGCNMLRKHVKVAPDRLYYWCDKLGLMVWQDMPSGDRYIRGSDPDLVRTKESADQFELEYKRMIEAFYNHPCIVMWVPFNEGWGQYDTARIADLTKKLDPTRLVNNASGWTDRKVGDVMDIHRYPGPGVPAKEEFRAGVLGEFGGLGLPVKGHTWQDEKNWGYRSFKTREELNKAYIDLLTKTRSLIGEGLAAAVYTQTSDVEIEVNGMMTYDRDIVKLDIKEAAEAARKLYLPPPIVKEIVPNSKQKAQMWSYTTTKPADGWEKPGFDDSSWKKGPGGFGIKMTPGAVVRTVWDTNDIWIRRAVEIGAGKFEDLQFAMSHDEDAEVYINGVLAAKTEGYTTSYVTVAISKEAQKAIKPGKNTIAIHCKQTMGGQYIDAGIIDIVEQKK